MPRRKLTPCSGFADRLEDAGRAADGAVLGQRPAGLSHEPHRRAGNRLVAARQEERMIGRWRREPADDSVLDFSEFFPGGVIKKLAEPLTK